MDYRTNIKILVVCCTHDLYIDDVLNFSQDVFNFTNNVFIICKNVLVMHVNEKFMFIDVIREKN